MKTIVFFLYFTFLAGLAGLVLQRCLWTPERLDPSCPEVFEIIPAGAPLNTMVTVVGRNFVAGRKDLFALTINGTPVDIHDISNDDTLHFLTKPGLKSGVVQVTRINSCTEPILSDQAFTYYYSVAASDILVGKLPPNNNSCLECFNSPRGMEVDGDSLYIADYNRHAIRRVSLTTRSVSTIAGTIDTFGYLNRSSGLASRFTNPSDVAVGPSGVIYVADEGNHCIRKIAGNGTMRGVDSLAGTPSQPSNDDVAQTPLSEARFLYPSSIATDKNGKIFVTEFSKNRLRVLDENARTAKRIITGPPLSYPAGVAYSIARNIGNTSLIYVANRDNGTLNGFTLNGVHDTFPSEDIYDIPTDAVLDDEGTLYVLDRGSRKVWVIYPDGNFNDLVIGNSSLAPVRPAGIALDKRNRTLYISDEVLDVIFFMVLE